MSSFRSKSARKSCRNQSKSIKFVTSCAGHVDGMKIKGSIEPTHGSVCSDVRKLQSMDVLKLQSAKEDWNTKCSFHVLAYIYSNLLDISTSYFIKILSYNENLT